MYASQPGSPPHHATLGSGWWPALAGQDSHLLGRIEGFRHSCSLTCLPPSPSFAWRNKYTILHPPRLHGSLSVNSMIQLFKGETIPKRQPIALDEITRENVDQFVDMDAPDDHWTR